VRNFSDNDFAKMTTELSFRLQATAEQFFSNHGIVPQPNTSLEQMSTPLIQVSRELLMFGADVWPSAAACCDAVASALT
jgi:hypothetical protein